MEYPEGPGNTNIPFRVEDTNKILEYENKIFEDYLEQRKLFINNIKNIDFNEFNNNDFRMVVLPEALGPLIIRFFFRTTSLQTALSI